MKTINKPTAINNSRLRIAKDKAVVFVKIKFLEGLANNMHSGDISAKAKVNSPAAFKLYL